jgi:hypothetical protein
MSDDDDVVATEPKALGKAHYVHLNATCPWKKKIADHAYGMHGAVKVNAH